LIQLKENGILSDTKYPVKGILIFGGYCDTRIVFKGIILDLENK
jgi:hypothetical protein